MPLQALERKGLVAAALGIGLISWVVLRHIYLTKTAVMDNPRQPSELA
jgi:hypothetical protein